MLPHSRMHRTRFPLHPVDDDELGRGALRLYQLDLQLRFALLRDFHAQRDGVRAGGEISLNPLLVFKWLGIDP